MNVDDVTAVIVTRGDVDLAPVIEPIIFDEVIVWNNAWPGYHDQGAYGRYLACKEFVETPYVYTVDDDCVVAPEAQQALIDFYSFYEDTQPGTLLVSNMNPNHNAGMPLLALPGWGAVFPTATPERAFATWKSIFPADFDSDDFRRIGCDIVFPVLTPARMVDLGHENLSYAWAMNRTHVQPGYAKKKRWYYEQAAKIRAVADEVAA